MFSKQVAQHRPLVAPLRLVTLLCLPAYAAAQYGPGYYDRGGTPGRVIAGIIVAICIALLFIILFSLMFRRRRRGSPILPWQGVPLRPQNQNQNQGSYMAYPTMNHQPSWGPGAGGYQPPPGPPPSSEPMPPPPYPGKPPAYEGDANSGYGYPQPPAQSPLEAPQPGGFVPPQSPHSPPAAHVNDSQDHSPWYRRS